jgi:hypothetical protein
MDIIPAWYVRRDIKVYVLSKVKVPSKTVKGIESMAVKNRWDVRSPYTAT